MIAARGPRVRRAGLALALALCAFPLRSQERQPATDQKSGKARLPPGIEIEAQDQVRVTPDGFEFTGPVTIRWRDSLIQADRMLLKDRQLEADGNVLIVWGGSRIFGNHMSYDLDTETGVIEGAIGQLESDYLFWAESAEKIGPETVRVKKATVTTCTQPIPYWAFRVSSATITLNQYARMWNPRIKAGKVPFFYLPYIVWPVKQKRAAGLLFPQFENTETRGFGVTQELFIPLGDNADLTLVGRYYTKAGIGGGAQARFLPNARGAAIFEGFYIDDKVAGFPRWAVSYRQTQAFENGFRMVADINQLSDFNVYSDFARDLELVSSPSILARIEFSRNGPFTSVNIREYRREQLFANGTGLVQQTFPEVELRGRSRKLGNTPLYLAYQTSATRIQQRGIQGGFPIDADYMRGDVFPVLTLPLSSVPWIEVTPLVGYRGTYWTQTQILVRDSTGSGPTRQVLDTSLNRQIWQAGLDVVGPKAVRIFNRGDKPGKTKYKHLIEPRLVYGWFSEAEDLANVLLYDEVDRFTGTGNAASYSLVQRLFAKKPRTRLETLEGPAGGVLIPKTYASTPSDAERFGEYLPDTPTVETDPDAPEEPVEIANFTIQQSYSFDAFLSFADLDRDGTNEEMSNFGPVQLNGRYNPNTFTSLDLRSSYDILFQEFRGATVSGSIRNQLAAIRFSLVHSNGLGVQPVRQQGTTILVNRDDDTQVRLTAGFNMLKGRLRLDLDGSIDFDPPDDGKHVPDRRIRLQYATQCCTITVEQLTREFSGLQDRNDFFFRVSLTGIGQILSVTY